MAEVRPEGGVSKPRDPQTVLSIREISHTYPDATDPALEPISLDVRRGEVVALTGPSGCGKSTLLNAVMGFLPPSHGTAEVVGRVAWVGQQPGLVPGTIADNVRLGHPAATDAAIREALDLAGAAALPLDQQVGDEAEGVSAGERRRIAVARALLRVTLGRAGVLVMDEPTAGLDADTEAGLLETLRRLGVAALVVSHRPAVLAAADRVIEIPGQARDDARPTVVPASTGFSRPRTTLPVPEPARDAARPTDPTVIPADAGISRPAASHLPDPAGENRITRPLLSRILAAVPGAKGRLALAGLFAFLATGSAVALMAVSAWLLSRAAELPPVLSLYAPATAVRALGIGRGVFRYLERLAGHDVALRLQSVLRLETYSRLARTTLLGRRRGDLLARVITDVEAIQDLVVRVWLPFSSAALVLLATAAALGFLSPASAVVLLLTSAVAALGVPWLARRASARADASVASLRGDLAGSVHAISRAASDLVAYGATEPWLARLQETDGRLRQAADRSAAVRGIASGVQVLAAGSAVVAALVIGGGQVADGTLAPVMLAVLVLTPLALHEALSSLTQSAQTHTRATTALQRVEAVLSADPVGSGDRVDVGGRVQAPALRLEGLVAGWSGLPVVTDLSLEVRAGEKVALTGPSGVGKTTVAATVLGLIPPLAGAVEVTGRVGYLAQDAHIFTTSVEENVRIGNRDADLAAVGEALRRAGLDLAPSRVIGEAGATLSGGEARRLALARLLVGDYQVLVLDEPTEHLDSRTATALVDDLWATSADRPVLVITHDPAVIARCDRVVALESAPVPA